DRLLEPHARLAIAGANDPEFMHGSRVGRVIVHDRLLLPHLAVHSVTDQGNGPYLDGQQALLHHGSAGTEIHTTPFAVATDTRWCAVCLSLSESDTSNISRVPTGTPGQGFAPPQSQDAGPSI